MRSLAILLALAGAACSQLPSTNRGAPMDLAGRWEGELSAGEIRLRVMLDVSVDDAGNLAADLDSPDQGAMDISVAQVSRDGRDLRFELPALGATYRATLSADGRALEGFWEQSGASLPLTLRKSATGSATRRPQEPAPPLPYEEQAVSYENRNVRLRGTLTVPRGDRIHPAVILIGGSGAHDRDQSVAGHRPFFVLADALTRRGVAVLRSDHRSFEQPAATFYQSTLDDYAGDALAAVNFLRSRDDIDRSRIGLLGHSQGGHVAILASSRSPEVAFIILIATPGVSGAEFISLQTRVLMRAAGSSEETVARALAAQQTVFDVLTSEPDDERAKALLRASIAGMSTTERNELGLTDEVIASQLEVMITPWYRRSAAFDPRPLLRLTSIPVLALNGEHDRQVPAEENLSAVRRALQEGRNPDVATAVLPRLNHLLQTSESGLPTEYAAIDETIAPAALKLIGDWIARRARRP